MTVVVRARGDAAALVGPIRAAIRESEPALPVPAPSLFADRVAESIALPRAFMRVLVAVGLAALALASIGIYGLVRYSVETRTREFGIRLAIGASPSGILTLVAREVSVLAALGVAAGVAGVFAAAKLLAALLVGVSATDVTMVALTTTVLLLVAGVAMLVPARRAMRTDPLE